MKAQHIKESLRFQEREFDDNNVIVVAQFLLEDSINVSKKDLPILRDFAKHLLEERIVRTIFADRYQEVRRLCEEVLECDPTNLRAFYDKMHELMTAVLHPTDFPYQVKRHD